METFEFCGIKLFVIRSWQGKDWVALKPVCDDIGINYQEQVDDLKDDPSFDCRDIPMIDAAGKPYQMTCIPHSKLYGWLYNINSNEVKPEIRGGLLQYQRECVKILGGVQI